MPRLLTANAIRAWFIISLLTITLAPAWAKQAKSGVPDPAHKMAQNPLTAVLFEWTAISAEDRQSLQRFQANDYANVDAGWWLANDRYLLLALPATEIAVWRKKYQGLQAFNNANPQSFAMQDIAHARDESALLPAIAKFGRGNLVRYQPYASALHPIAINQQLVLTESAVRSKAPDPQLQPIIDRISPTRWFAALSQLASWKRNSYGTEIDQARDYLVSQFTALGMSVETPTVNFSGASTENVVATLTGSSLANEWIVIGAHYDSRNTSVSNTTNPSPGAEDNASGCAGVLEIARVLADTSPKRTIKFICFTGEEQNLYGSEAYAASLASAGTLSNVKLAVIMDMIGYSSTTALDVLLETSSALQSVLPPFHAAAADYSPGMTVSTSLNPFGSDHMPFINRSVPSLLLIENEWDSYPHYHKATDTPANVTNAQLQGPAVLRMLLAVVAQRAELGRSGEFANGFE